MQEFAPWIASASCCVLPLLWTVFVFVLGVRYERHGLPYRLVRNDEETDRT